MVQRRAIVGSGAFIAALQETALREVAEASGGASVVTVEALMRKLGVERGEAVARLQRLEAAGGGKFIAGRRGHPSRFEWKFGTKERRAALEGDAEHPDYTPHEAAPTHEPDAAPAGLITHRIHVRPNVVAELTLPSDLTAGEAERLCAILVTLPFE